jgi:hypothetical protein
MANKVFTGTRQILSTDYNDVKWVGKTKDGREVVIKLLNAINLENIDWKMAEKDEVIASVVYVGTYEENATDNTTEPWSVTYVDGTATGTNKPDNILLGVGVFYIGTTAIGLSRGGGQFTLERKYRNIAADGDFGTVKGRTAIDSSEPKLKMNLLEVISANLTKLYPATKITDATE